MAEATLEQIAGVLDRLHRHKTVGYGDAWRKRGEVLSIFANIARKYDRLEVALGQGIRSEDERVIDTVADLCVYAGKYLTWLAEQHPDAFETGGAPFSASSCTDARGPDALRAVLDGMVDQAPSTEPASIAAAFQDVRDEFANLETGLMAQAEGVEDRTLDWTAKVGAAFALMVSSGILTVLVAREDPTAYEAWLAEVDAMDRAADGS